MCIHRSSISEYRTTLSTPSRNSSREIRPIARNKIAVITSEVEDLVAAVTGEVGEAEDAAEEVVEAVGHELSGVEMRLD